MIVFLEGRMKYQQIWALCGVLLLVMSSPGCGKHDDPLNRQAISGSVTLDGQPLQQGTISFLPLEKKDTSGGATITSGKYSVAREQGLAPGKYKVMISASKSGVAGGQEAPGMPVMAAELIPEEYNTKSDKSVDVTVKGPNTFDFDITSKK